MMATSSTTEARGMTTWKASLLVVVGILIVGARGTINLIETSFNCNFSLHFKFARRWIRKAARQCVK